MKNLLLPVLLTSFLFLACENKEASNDDRNTLLYARTALGGCNAPVETIVARSIQISEPDTAIITITEDTVSFYVGVNYII